MMLYVGRKKAKKKKNNNGGLNEITEKGIFQQKVCRLPFSFMVNCPMFGKFYVYVQENLTFFVNFLLPFFLNF